MAGYTNIGCLSLSRAAKETDKEEKFTNCARDLHCCAGDEFKIRQPVWLSLFYGNAQLPTLMSICLAFESSSNPAGILGWTKGPQWEAAGSLAAGSAAFPSSSRNPVQLPSQVSPSLSMNTQTPR
ncbi:hypothetical protein MGG_17929 [Pyricularia oryzae 70-15]|uniref:Uncharacterized protein n=3 Tax=Pyricularia oryzae TaxID=318829 RepID=G4NLL5_PYRO7|nr:uncharacterized protein MGG_17929 [Pyricularia oryzae 70-15]EHA46068.1 hypothetical protein MGG_17929 [Pyricularia oryzae 70-15]ELQ40200.1 hypothetical protein OOU_Y34scaffold00458g28 [Pyricularia oryzae Y34]